MSTHCIAVKSAGDNETCKNFTDDLGINAVYFMSIMMLVELVIFIWCVI